MLHNVVCNAVNISYVILYRVWVCISTFFYVTLTDVNYTFIQVESHTGHLL
jgi:hypothetical protein